MGMHHAVCVPRVVVGWPLLATLFGPHCVVGSACARTLLAHRHPHCTATPIAPSLLLARRQQEQTAAFEKKAAKRAKAEAAAKEKGTTLDAKYDPQEPKGK